MYTEFSRFYTTESAINVASSVHAFVCSFLGMDEAFPWTRLMGSFIWISVAASNVLNVVAALHSLVSEALRGLSELTYSVGVSLWLSWTLVSISTFMINGRKARRFIRSRVESVADVVIPLVCFLPVLYTFTHVAIAQDNFMLFLSYITYIVFKLLTMLFYSTYLTICGHVVSKLQRLYNLASQSAVTLDELMRRKLETRDEIQAVNLFFSKPLAVLYFELFISMVYHISAAVTPDMDCIPNTLLAGCLCIHTSLVFLIARKSSKIQSESLSIELRIWKRIMKENAGSLSDQELMALNVCRFREEWDALQAASFTLSKGNFVSYVSTVVTLVVVVLQFDYQIVRRLTTLAGGPL